MFKLWLFAPVGGVKQLYAIMVYNFIYISHDRTSNSISLVL